MGNVARYNRHHTCSGDLGNAVDECGAALLAHPAATELLDDAVIRDGLADERIGIRHGAARLD